MQHVSSNQASTRVWLDSKIYIAPINKKRSKSLLNFCMSFLFQNLTEVLVKQ